MTWSLNSAVYSMFQLPQDEYHEINIFDTAIVVFIVDFVVQFFKMSYKDESVAV